MPRPEPAWRAWRELSSRHPRELLLGAAVLGLLAGPHGAAAVAGAGAVACLATGRRRALAGVLAILAGAVVAQARMHALDHTRLGPPWSGERTFTATLLERPRPTASGHARAALVR